MRASSRVSSPGDKRREVPESLSRSLPPVRQGVEIRVNLVVGSPSKCRQEVVRNSPHAGAAIPA